MADKNKASFSNNLGFIFAAIGGAVGMGNLWRFPFYTSSYGGCIFIIIYLCFIVFLGIPCVLAETAIGRRARKDPTHCYSEIYQQEKGKNSKFWRIAGHLPLLVPLAVCGYYFVVASWAFRYFVMSFTVPLDTLNIETFRALNTNTGVSMFYVILALTIVAAIVMAGVQNGIERISKILVPSLFVFVVILAIRTLTTPGAEEGLAFMLQPNVQNVIDAGGFGFVALKALGACFASLSLGYGQYMIFGAYLGDKDNIARNSVVVPLSDTAFALLAGFTIIPMIFISGQTPGTGGSGTLFGTMPLAFASLGPTLGRIFCALFFLVAIFAAITSLTPVLEVGAAWLNETFNINRKKGVIIISLMCLVVNAMCILGYGPLAGVSFFGMNFFDFWATVVDWILPLSALSIAIFVGWIWTPEEALKEITKDGGKFAIFPVWKVLVKYVAPICILAVFIMTVF